LVFLSLLRQLELFVRNQRLVFAANSQKCGIALFLQLPRKQLPVLTQLLLQGLALALEIVLGLTLVGDQLLLQACQLGVKFKQLVILHFNSRGFKFYFAVGRELDLLRLQLMHRLLPLLFFRHLFLVVSKNALSLQLCVFVGEVVPL
jgi:hypothetical protein